MTQAKLTKTERDPFTPEVRQVRAEEQATEAARREYDFKQALLDVLETRSGKIVFARLFADCGFFASSFDTNALKMARKEGKKEFAQTVFDYVLKYAPGVIFDLRKDKECQTRPQQL